MNTFDVPKVLPSAGQAWTAGKSSVGSFGALLAQVISSDDEGAARAPDAKTAPLAEMLGRFREEAQESLAEVFPDGVVVPGPAFDDWARSMLTKLDGLLKETGASLSDLTQMLAQIDGFAGEMMPLLMKAAQVLVAEAEAPATPVAEGEAPAAPASAATGAVPGTGAGDSAKAVTGQPAGPARESAAQPVAMAAVQPNDAAAVQGGQAAPVTAEASVVAVEIAAAGPLVVAGVKLDGGSVTAAGGARPTKAVTQATEELLAAAEKLPANAPLPDALRLLLAQVVAAPADQKLPPEIQAMLSAQPQSALVPIAAAPPVQAPQQPNPPQRHSFARNLAGQIRGVSFTEGTTRIELTPNGLGKLEIEIAPDESGRLRVVIRAENPSVLQAMRSDREMLAGLLRDGGTTVDDGAMSFEDLGQRQGPAGQGTQSGPARSAAPMAEDDAAPIQETPVNADGRLNILM